MATTKQLTNTQAVKEMMDFSAHGALAQLFIIDAIGKAADNIAAADLDELSAAFGPNAFVSADAWQAVAKEVKAKLDAHLKR